MMKKLFFLVALTATVHTSNMLGMEGLEKKQDTLQDELEELEKEWEIIEAPGNEKQEQKYDMFGSFVFVGATKDEKEKIANLKKDTEETSEDKSSPEQSIMLRTIRDPEDVIPDDATDENVDDASRNGHELSPA